MEAVRRLSEGEAIRNPIEKTRAVDASFLLSAFDERRCVKRVGHARDEWLMSGQSGTQADDFRTNPHSGDSLLTVHDAERNTTNMLVFDV